MACANPTDRGGSSGSGNSFMRPYSECESPGSSFDEASVALDMIIGGALSIPSPSEADSVSVLERTMGAALFKGLTFLLRLGN